MRKCNIPAGNCLECGMDLFATDRCKAARKRFCCRSCKGKWHGRDNPERMAAMRRGQTPESGARRNAAAAAARNTPEVQARRVAAMKANRTPESIARRRAALAASRTPENEARRIAAMNAARTPESEARRIAAMVRGPDHPNWNGGTSASQRPQALVRKWRAAVFERDDYTCQGCGKRGVQLQADHIMPYALYPELRWDVSNGRTLCIPCHKLTPTFAGKMKVAMRRTLGDT